MLKEKNIPIFHFPFFIFFFSPTFHIFNIRFRDSHLSPPVGEGGGYARRSAALWVCDLRAGAVVGPGWSLHAGGWHRKVLGFSKPDTRRVINLVLCETVMFYFCMKYILVQNPHPRKNMNVF